MFDNDAWHQPHPIVRLERHEERFERWEFLHGVPDLKLDHGFASANEKLYVTTHHQNLQDYSFCLQQWTKKNIDQNNSVDAVISVDDFSQPSLEHPQLTCSTILFISLSNDSEVVSC